MKKMRYTDSSDSHFNGWGVSRTRNFGLWNLYSSELDDLTVLDARGDIPVESGGRTVVSSDPCFSYSVLRIHVPHSNQAYGVLTVPGS